MSGRTEYTKNSKIGKRNMSLIAERKMSGIVRTVSSEKPYYLRLNPYTCLQILKK